MNTSPPWSVKGVDPECREAAKVAARKSGMTIGSWLNRAILSQAAAELRRDPATTGANGVPGSQLPALPKEVLLKAVAEIAADMKAEVREEVRDEVRRESRRIAEEQLAPVARSVVELSQRLGRLDSLSDRISQVEDTSRRLAAMDGLAEKVRAVEGLAERLPSQDELAQQIRQAREEAEKAALAVAPLEKSVRRLMERLEREQDRPAGPGRAGLFGRLFGE